MGLAISGNIAVEPGKVRLQASLPLAVMVFKSTIEKRILQEFGELLAVSPGCSRRLMGPASNKCSSADRPSHGLPPTFDGVFMRFIIGGD